MPRFVASTGKGLIELLEQEIQLLGGTQTEKLTGGVGFEANWAVAYRVLLRTRFATRLLQPLRTFTAYQPDELYGQVQKIDFTRYISERQLLAVDAKVRDSKFTDQRFIGLKVKDAIVDQFVSKLGSRPNIDSTNPDLSIVVRVVRNQVMISLDLAGLPLSNRGWRLDQGEAPLRENLAAAMVTWTGWTGTGPFIDPMCGSGTILIEAAMTALSLYGDRYKKGYLIERLKHFRREDFENELSSMFEARRQRDDLQIYGFDQDPRAIEAARANIERAGLSPYIKVKQCAFKDLTPPTQAKGILVVNPPYGERLASTQSLENLFFDMGQVVKSKFRGWSLYLLCGSPEEIRKLHMKAARRWPIWNSAIECRFLKYDILERPG